MMERELLISRDMRSTLIVSAVLVATAACGGSVAPGSSGSSGSSGSNKTGGDTGNSSGSDGWSLRCTPGAFVFCRCADRSEGRKLCQEDGRAFSACACETTPVQCEVQPPEPNSPGCPATYSSSYSGQPCGGSALECAYPGAGDLGPDGCVGTALLSCRIAPGGNRYWYAAP